MHAIGSARRLPQACGSHRRPARRRRPRRLAPRPMKCPNGATWSRRATTSIRWHTATSRPISRGSACNGSTPSPIRCASNQAASCACRCRGCVPIRASRRWCSWPARRGAKRPRAHLRSRSATSCAPAIPSRPMRRRRSRCAWPTPAGCWWPAARGCASIRCCASARARRSTRGCAWTAARPNRASARSPMRLMHPPSRLRPRRRATRSAPRR